MKVTAKGQVTIPAKIRQQLRFLPGTEIELLVEEDAVIIVSVREANLRGRRIVERMLGKGSIQMTTDEIMALTRGDA